MGNAALYNNTTGGGNTAIGQTLWICWHCNNNTAIDTMLAIQLKVIKMPSGYEAGRNETGSNKLYISNTLALIFCMAIFLL